MAASARVRAAGRLGASLAPALDVRWVLAGVLGAVVGWLVLPPLVVLVWTSLTEVKGVACRRSRACRTTRSWWAAPRAAGPR